MVVFDTSTLILALNPKARGPIDPSTNSVVSNCKGRVEHLLATLHKAKTPILLPTPVLAEYLVKAGPEKHQMLDRFTTSKNFVVGSFDLRAAIDLAELLGDPDLQRKRLDDKVTKAKMRFDRQVVSIAKSRGASPIYTDDSNLASIARSNGIAAIMTWDIPLPQQDPNLDLWDEQDDPEA